MSRAIGSCTPDASDAHTAVHFLTLFWGFAMRKMIRMAVMAAVMFVAVSTVAKAQDPQPQGRRGGGGRGGVAALVSNLGLDSTTMAKVQEIAQKYQAQQRELMQGGAPDQAKMAELQSKRNDEIKALLNADQKAKFEENVKNAPARRGGPPPAP